MTSYIAPYKGFVRCNTVGILPYSRPIKIQINPEIYMKVRHMPCSCCPENFRVNLS